LNQFQKIKEQIFDKLEKELHPHLSYHNIDHTTDVMQAAETIAGNEGISSDDKRLLLTAALFHDSGFLVAREGHEVFSCDIARQYLPEYGYTAGEIARICGMIMATRLPQSPQNLLEQILCDADLDYLGRDDFFMLSDKLFDELRAENLVKDKEEWDMQQTDFMQNHRYFTQTSVNRRQAKKEEYIKLINPGIST
jgi:uncharacterized protein